MSQSMKDRRYQNTNGRKIHLKKKTNCGDVKLIVFKHINNGPEHVQNLSKAVMLAKVVNDINQISAIFKENLIVVNNWTVLVLGSVPQSLALLQEKTNRFKQMIQKNDTLDLCSSKETFVICTESTPQQYVIQKSLETKAYFTALEENVEDIFRSKSYRRVYFEDLKTLSNLSESIKQPEISEADSINRPEITEVELLQNRQKLFRRRVKYNKVLAPRNNKTTITVLPTSPLRTLVCYPLTGTFHLNPAMPADEVSFPTQVSQQPEPGTDEVVFSSGRSIKVDHVINGQAPRQLLQVSSNPGPSTRYLEDLHTNQRSRSQLKPQGILKRPPKPPRYPQYVEHHQRLRSFARWVKRYPSPTALCEAGFFFTNEGDTVRCYQCGIGLKDFSYGDNPLTEHVRHSRDCPFLHEYIEPDRLAKIKTELQEEDHANRSNTQGSETVYRHLRYVSYNARLSSFSKWPQRLMQTPQQLSEAGFFYTECYKTSSDHFVLRLVEYKNVTDQNYVQSMTVTHSYAINFVEKGFEDNVRCFACDGGLRQWDPEDDPWIEHCRWFPDCPYVKEQKGEDYARLLQTTTATGEEGKIPTRGQATLNTKPGSDVTSEFERLTLKDPELNAVIAEHRETCLEMGYPEKDFEKAAYKLAREGTVRPTIEDILDALEANQLEERSATRENNVTETPIEENMRLKSMIICMNCEVNSVNALFLPCTHHRMCMECAGLITQCPVCDRHIRQKIRTYMA